MSVVVRVLSAEEGWREQPALAEILADCVNGGASVSFMWPFSVADAHQWWGEALADVAAGGAVLFGAFLDGALVGTVQLAFPTPPNQCHRADVRKLLVHARARGGGVATALMHSLEAEACRRSLTLLALDTVTGSDADRLYRRLGWTSAGVVPNFALWPDGRPCDATIFWKALA